MNWNILSPNVYIIPCTQFANPITNFGSINQTQGQCFTAALNGGAIFGFYGFDGYGNNAPASLLYVKPDASWCWYSTTNEPKNVYTECVTLQAQFAAANSYRLIEPNNGYVRTMTVPNTFMNGAFIQMSSYSPSIVAPCDAPYDAIEFYSSGDRALINFVQAFPDAYNLWCETADITSSGLRIRNAGFAGNFPNSVNPTVGTNSFFPLLLGPPSYGMGDEDFAYDVWGNLVGGDQESNDDGKSIIYAMVVGRQSIIDGSLTCVSGGTIPQLNQNLGYTLLSQQSRYAGTQFQADYEANYAGACDIRGCASLSNGNGALDLTNGINFVELSGLAGPQSVYSGGIVYSITANSVSLATPAMAIDSLLGPQPNAGNNAMNLVNLHRAVSVVGNFIT